MPLIPFPESSEMTSGTRQLLDEVPLGDLVRIMAVAGEICVPWLRLVNAVTVKGDLDDELRELATLRVGHHCGSQYELSQHTKMAQEIGMSDARIAAAFEELPSQHFTAAENLALRFVDEVFEEGKGSPETLEELRRSYRDSDVVELIVIVGLYRLIAGVTETLEILPAPVRPKSDKRAGLADFQEILARLPN
jgi:4-carboxymuconolactone decarboxylase